MSIHVPYELKNGTEYDESARTIVKQGLCWTMGDHFTDFCSGVSREYLHESLFKYYTYRWAVPASLQEQKMRDYVDEVEPFKV